MRRSLIICLLVGTLVIAINQGNRMVAGDFPREFAWKLPLTNATAYTVATTSAILNARAPRE